MGAELDILLVATHPRSGTHLCINSLCLNVRNVTFGLVRGQYPTLERLLLDHDDAYAREFEAHIRPLNGFTRIVKTHLRPSEIRMAIESPGFLNERDRALARSIMERSRCLYVYRDGRDVMVSWYHYMVQFGGGLPSDILPRLQKMGFAEFLRMPNKYYPPVRGFQPEDASRPRYWAAHADEWMAQPGVISVAFEALIANFEGAIRELARELGWPDRVIEPVRMPMLGRHARGGLLGKLWHGAHRRGVAFYHRVARGVQHYPPSPAFARKGESGGWRSSFTEEDKRYFLDQAGATLTRLGYDAG